MKKLRNQFKEETGIDWMNSQGEPDIDYVQWLENKLSLKKCISACREEEISCCFDCLKK
jgi:hypothetical protein